MSYLDEITWRPGIGDPSLIGWLTVAAYGLTAWIAFRRSTTGGSKSGSVPDDRVAWFVVALALALLCVNKQLDLQSLLTDLGRVLARRQGWYASRHEVLGWFVYAIIGTFLVVATVSGVLFGRFWRRHVLLGTGLVFLFCFVAVRAVSLHSFDGMINTTWHGFRVNSLLELTGIAMVAVAAVRG